MSRYKAYPEYKDSGIDGVGLVPVGWKVKKLKWEIFANSGTDAKDEHGEFELFGANGVIGKTNTTIKNNANGTVLVGRVGSAGAINFVVGKVGISDNAIIIRNFAHDAVRFDYYVFLSQNLSELVSKNAQPLITASSVRDVKVPLPFHEHERKTIANFLDHETAKIDTLIVKQQELIKLLKEKRQAVISHAVTKGLNPNASMRDSGVEWLGEVPEHWSLLPLKRAVELQRGHDLPSEARTEGNIPIVSSGGVIAYHNEVKAKGPGIVTGRYGTIGEFYLEVRDYWPLNTALYSVNTYQNNVKYLWYMLQSIKHLFVLNSMKSAVPGVDRNDLHPEFISLPIEPFEQQQIVDYLDAKLKQFDEIENRSLKGVELLRERRTALISAAVTGKIDVRNWQPPVSETQAA